MIDFEGSSKVKRRWCMELSDDYKANATLNSLTSLHCPTCNGPLSKDVLENPVQCIYCDVWVATNDGRQQKVILSHAQIADLGKGIQPSEPIFKEGSPLERLFGRIRRVVPMIIGVPLVWVLMMHLFVGTSVDWTTRSSDG